MIKNWKLRLKQKVYISNELGYHIPTLETKEMLDKANMYEFWKFADLNCDESEFENIIPLIIAFCLDKLESQK